MVRVRLQHACELWSGRSDLSAWRTGRISGSQKPAAGFYKSQCDPAEEVVLEAAFHWARSDESLDFTPVVVCSNCEHLKFYMREKSLESNPWVLVTEADPERTEFNHLKYAPFIVPMKQLNRQQFKFPWGDRRLRGTSAGSR